MPLKGSDVNREMFQYIRHTFSTSMAELLKQMKRRAEDEGMPGIMISENQAQFLRMVVEMTGAERCIEVGTLFGYSAAVMHSGQGSDGRVVTLEKNSTYVQVARDNFQELGIGENIDIQQGEATQILPEMEENQFDLFLIDADKTNYPFYFSQGLRLLDRPGILMADNGFAHGKITHRDIDESDDMYETVMAIREFNEKARSVDDGYSILVPLGDGFTMTYLADSDSDLT